MSGAYSNQTFSRNGPSHRSIHQRRLLLGLMLVGALVGFEMFNYSTTQVALHDLLGDLRIFRISWATMLAVAFCGIDFAGIARLFMPEDSETKAAEVWYLFGAWLLAATMNAILTWWGISLAIVNRPLESSAFIDQRTINEVVPVFLALMIWITRILLIGSFSITGPRLFSKSPQQTHGNPDVERTPRPVAAPRPLHQPAVPSPLHASDSRHSVPAGRPAPKPRPEPEYISEPGYTNHAVSFQTLGGNREQDRSTTVDGWYPTPR